MRHRKLSAICSEQIDGKIDWGEAFTQCNKTTFSLAELTLSASSLDWRTDHRSRHKSPLRPPSSSRTSPALKYATLFHVINLLHPVHREQQFFFLFSRLKFIKFTSALSRTFTHHRRSIIPKIYTRRKTHTERQRKKNKVYGSVKAHI